MYRVLFLTCAVLILTNNSFANDIQEKQSDQTQADEVESSQTATSQATKPDYSSELAGRVMTMIIDGMEIEDEKKVEIKKIIKTSMPNLVDLESKYSASLTPEQHKKYKAAFRLATKASFTKERAEAYALGQLRLPKEQKQTFVEARGQLRLARVKMNNEIASLLTKEQRAKLPMFNQRQNSGYATFNLWLPMAQSEDDVKKAESRLKGMANIKVGKLLEKEEARGIQIQIKHSRVFRNELDKLVAEGINTFDDYALEKPASADQPASEGSSNPPEKATDR